MFKELLLLILFSMKCFAQYDVLPFDLYYDFTKITTVNGVDYVLD